ncbi:HelD family protein [Arsenicicoccus sp. oral taxon 190]|uniref:HelD family protein n=1 Tax=Arsenicicoccus sp. oral taxon 190 TaxID=1658671 RepID=UPI00067A2167|nr:AAA family ATPase [Arsenicicoccus sp. oral taxon 190]AKT50360.1 helicase [Arsenicicoccus sp. oral taxon 190]
MTDSQQRTAPSADDLLHAELATEQTHVDRVYAELERASVRARLLEAEGLSRGRTDRVGDVRDEEASALFERDALMFNAARRRASLDSQHEGLVFGRLDIDHPAGPGEGREVRYVGRLGVRDEDYEPLVIDWRAPAAAPFYRSTPADPMGVLRRRVLRCRGPQVVGVEDDLMVPEAPDDLVVIGDGALMAALTRSRGARMRDIVATIQQHQDEAIRASARGVTEITGGPGTGKTVVALHRAAYLLYSDRRRFESGGVLVVGPSAAYTAYIERVLPSLGEDSVALRALGDLVDGMSTERLDSPAAAAVKGSLRMRAVLARAARGRDPLAPTELRTMIAGHPVRLDAGALDRVRRTVLRHQRRNGSWDAAHQALGEAAWSVVHGGDREEFFDAYDDHLEVDAFLRDWWRPLDPREVVLWLADPELLARHARGLLSPEEQAEVAASLQVALRTGIWSVADVALVDEVAARVGPYVELEQEERGFYEIEELDAVERHGVHEVTVGRHRLEAVEPRAELAPATARDRLLAGRIGEVDEYAHVLVDEAQDVSPMQWRALGRRGRWGSWTVVGDAAQASWPDAAEAAEARDEAWGGKEPARFHMTTNYRNAAEIFDYASRVIRAAVPDADIPQAVRETGVEPVDVTVPRRDLAGHVVAAARALLEEVDGLVTVILPASWDDLRPDLEPLGDRVVAIDPLSTKGLEYDATVVVDPDAIVAQTAGGIRTLYVVLTRAAHRMTVVRPADAR